MGDRTSLRRRGSRYTPLPNPTGGRSLVGVLPTIDGPMTVGRTMGATTIGILCQQMGTSNFAFV